MTGTTRPGRGVAASPVSGGKSVAVVSSTFGGATNFGVATQSFGGGSQNSSFAGDASVFGNGNGGNFGNGQGGTFGTGSGGTFGSGAGGPSGAIQERGSSLSSGAVQERGSSLSSGAIQQRGSSLSSGAIRQQGSSFSSGAIQAQGSFLSSGAIRERGSSFSSGAIRERGSSFSSGAIRPASSGSSRGSAFSSGGGGGGLSGGATPLKSGVRKNRARPAPVFTRTKFGDEVVGKLVLQVEQEYDERGNLQPMRVIKFAASINGKNITPSNYVPWMASQFGGFTYRDNTEQRYYDSKTPYSDDCHVWLNQPYEEGYMLRQEKVTVVAQPGEISSEHYFAPPEAGASIFISNTLTTKPTS